MKTGKVLGLSALVLALTACDTGDSAQEHVARANQFIADADYPSAIIELKNALQTDSQSAEARYLLGKAYLEAGDLLPAQKELERAIELGGQDGDAQLALARVLLLRGEHAQVRDMTVSGLKPDEEADMLALQASAALGLGDSWEAERLVGKALAIAPESNEALLANARILASQQDLEGALTALDQMIAQDPGQTRAWSLRGDILRNNKDYTGALKAYDEAVASLQNNYSDMYKRAMLNLQLGNYEASQADATILLAKAPQHPGPNYIQGLLHFQAGRYEEAITTLSVAEPAFKQYPAILFFLGSAQLMEGNTDLAASLAARFHKLVPGSIRGRKLLATIRLQQGKYVAVETLLAPVLDGNPDDIDALNLTANALLEQGKINEGVELLSRVATLQPDSPVAQVRLGAGLLLGDQGNDASLHIETALELDPEYQQADILKVLNHLQEEDYPAAIAAAESFQRRNVTSVTPYNLLGRVYQEAGQKEEARDAFRRALALDSADPAANHSLAQMALAEDDIDSAREFYETVLKANPDSASTLIELATLDARENDEEAMLKHLEQAMVAEPTALQPRLLLGRYYLGKKRPEQVAPLFTNLRTSQQQSPEVLRLLAIAQLSSSDKSGAQFTLQQLLESSPDSASIRYMMAMAVADDEKRTKEELERAIALNENHVPSHLALARIAFANNSRAEFEGHMQKLMTLDPDNANVMLLQAADESSRGNDSAALALAEKAFGHAPSRGTLIVLASYQEANGDWAASQKGYRQWLDQHPDDTAVRLSLANSLQLSEHLDEASKQYAAVLETDPDNAVALNNLAWIARKDNPALALEYARKASTIAPKSPEVLDTLAVVEYHNKNYLHAARTIERALRARPDNASMLYHSAMIDVAQNDNAAARATLTKLLASDSDFAEIADAQALLKQLSN